jgi:virginiamycin B lyase
MSTISPRRRALTLSVGLAVVALSATAVPAQDFTTFTEWRIPAPASQPLYMSASGNNGAYFAEQFAGKIGFLDTRKSLLTEWTLPAGSQPTGAVPQGQKVAFAEENGHVAILDPNGSTLTEWAVPVIESFSLPLGVATQGKLLFFTDYFQGVVGMLNTSTNEMTLWPMPGAPSRRPNQMVLNGPASRLQVWVADSVGIISVLDPSTNTFTEWHVPPQPSQPVFQNLAIAPDGSLLFQEFVNSRVGVLTPSANLLRQWLVPTPSSFPVNVAVLAPGLMAFAEQEGNRIGTLDLATTPTSTEAVTPTATAVTPSVFVVPPTLTALAQTVTPITPTVTGASRTVTGGFVEYPVPTPLSGPVGLATNSNGAILFTESSAAGNSVGLLR